MVQHSPQILADEEKATMLGEVFCYPFIKSFTAPNLHSGVDQTLQVSISTVAAAAVHWAFSGFWFATRSCQLPYCSFFLSFHQQKWNLSSRSVTTPFNKFRKHMRWVTVYLSRQFMRQIWLCSLFSVLIKLSVILPNLICSWEAVVNDSWCTSSRRKKEDRNSHISYVLPTIKRAKKRTLSISFACNTSYTFIWHYHKATAFNNHQLNCWNSARFAWFRDVQDWLNLSCISVWVYSLAPMLVQCITCLAKHRVQRCCLPSVFATRPVHAHKSLTLSQTTIAMKLTPAVCLVFTFFPNIKTRLTKTYC